jgi:hypothetical protein
LLFVFAAADDPVVPASSFTALCQFLAESRQSPVRRYTPKGADIDDGMDVRAIFQQGHRELASRGCRQFALRDRGITTLAICGIALEIGIEPTVRLAADLGVVPVVEPTPAVRVTRKREAASISFASLMTH